ncbi:trypsin-like peptidase domain-containing protein [Candidatus Peregrinibacteria bacterium]|nr:trypsin-like peptidase domain-containing protein [Candidatus Peregrinibacteria bacterium]
MKNTLPPKFAVQVIFIALLSGMVGAGIYTKIQKPTAALETAPAKNTVEQRVYVEESETISAIQKVVPSVVSIVAAKDLQIFREQPFDPFFFFEDDPFFRDFGFQAPRRQRAPQEPQEPQTKRQVVAGGTGFIIEADGLAVTNRHVVSDQEADYTALTKDGREYDVEIISRDPGNDLAVIQLREKTEEKKERKTGEKRDFGPKPKDLPRAELGDSAKLKVGQKVLAVGNARGEYQNSVTSGIISAIGRDIQASDMASRSQQNLSGLIQTDAAINFGNSGGPLVNLAGEVIGVNTAIDASATGVGFAIPIHQVTPVIQSVKKFGRIVRPVLGVMHIMLDKEKAKELKIDGVEYGALITGDRSKKEFGVVPGSPAEKAGLKLDDVILEVDGQKVNKENTLQNVVQKHAPGDTLKLKVRRDGKEFGVSVKLEEKKE